MVGVAACARDRLLQFIKNVTKQHNRQLSLVLSEKHLFCHGEVQEVLGQTGFIDSDDGIEEPVNGPSRTGGVLGHGGAYMAKNIVQASVRSENQSVGLVGEAIFMPLFDNSVNGETRTRMGMVVITMGR